MMVASSPLSKPQDSSKPTFSQKPEEVLQRVLDRETLSHEGRCWLQSEENLAAVFQAATEKQYTKTIEGLAGVVTFAEGNVPGLEKAAEYAKNYFETTEGIKISLSTELEKIFYGIMQAISSVVTVVGLADLLKPSDTSTLASIKFQRVFVLFVLLATLYGALNGALGATVALSTVTGLVGLIIGLTILFAYLPPFQFPCEAENWTLQYHFGERAKVEALGRKEALEKMARRLNAKDQHVAVIGKSGVGKTWTVESLAQTCADSDPNDKVFGELKEKVFLCFDCSKLINRNSAFESIDVLKMIEDSISHDPNKYILVFDEFQAAVKDEKLAQGFKKFLERISPARAIIVTTEQEYEEYMRQHPPLVRRFGGEAEAVKIANTEQIKTQEVLKKHLLRTAPEAVLGKYGEVLSYISAQSETLSANPVQPGQAQSLLDSCLSEVRMSGKLDSLDLEEEMRELERQEGEGFTIPPGKKEGLQAQIKGEKEKPASPTKEEIDGVKQLLQRLAEIKQKMYKAAMEKNANVFKLSEICVKVFEEKIQAASDKLKTQNVHIVLDKQLVDQVVDRKKARQEVRI